MCPNEEESRRDNIRCKIHRPTSRLNPRVINPLSSMFSNSSCPRCPPLSPIASFFFAIQLEVAGGRDRVIRGISLGNVDAAVT